MKQRLHFIWKGTYPRIRATVNRVVNMQPVRMKCLAFAQTRNRSAIQHITDDRMPDVGKMYANLMRAPGKQG